MRLWWIISIPCIRTLVENVCVKYIYILEDKPLSCKKKQTAKCKKSSKDIAD
jgi:hypothetical protein